VLSEGEIRAGDLVELTPPPEETLGAETLPERSHF
jgi:MOSC domain-containing protein YiiM